MGEKLDLTTPITEHTITGIHLDWKNAQIVITWENSLGHGHALLISGGPATAMMIAINKTDFSVKSLQRTVLERLVSDGVLVGTISGTPD